MNHSEPQLNDTPTWPAADEPDKPCLINSK
jgi:hypothetical protein